MRKITDELELGLNKVTVARLIVLKELGLYDINVANEEIMKRLLEIFINKDELDRLLKTIFKDVGEYNFEDVDITEVFGGYQDFLMKLIGNSA